MNEQRKYSFSIVHYTKVLMKSQFTESILAHHYLASVLTNTIINFKLLHYAAISKINVQLEYNDKSE